MSNDPELNKAIALGRVWIDRDPLRLLQEMRASVSYAPHLGFVIVLGKDHDSYMFKQLTDCIAFNTGGDTNLTKGIEVTHDKEKRDA